MKRIEQEEQMKVIEWAQWQKGRFPCLELLFHIPNGGGRTKAEGGILKAMGVKKGIPDLFLPCARGGYNGLFIEMKAEGGTVSREQGEIMAQLRSEGYSAEVCVGASTAISVIEKYLKSETFGKGAKG